MGSNCQDINRGPSQWDGGGPTIGPEEIIDLGIKLDDAKEIIEERLKPTPSLQVQFGETEALIEVLRKEVDNKNHIILNQEDELEGKNKTIAELKERVDKLGKTIDNLMDERDEWKGDGQDTSIDEQVAEYVPYREGDE